ncbi:smc n terminal domain-containing protein [Cystoisospora suis]|uniref:Smc n terminal domain-containing protein n=1 Tax=Cystoisospora suis TaxID=483139 RepID=A0A2C6KIC3_9APIC|nr:smc n terminal domain-containing protein [Cystoisospora suis]
MAASTSASTRSSTKREDRQMKNVFPLVPLQSKHELKKTSLGEDKAGGAAHGMNQLSGGQKSIVSLALLLALQRVACCSPSEGRGASRISDYEGRSRGDGELQSFLSPSTTPQRDERRSRRRRANCAGERLGDHDEEEEEDEDEKDQQERLREQPGGVLLLDEVDAALDENHRRAAAEALRQTTAQRISQIILTTFRPELLDPADCFYHVSQANRVSHVDVVDIDTAIHLLQEQQGDEGNMEELEEDPRVKGEDEEAVSLPLPLTAH